MNGDWCARRLEGAHVQQIEEAGCSQAISLELPPGEQLSTQFLIHCWHTQHAVHALRHPPMLLMLQFSRYSFGPTGACKNHVHIQWPRTLNIPLFIDAGLDSCNITYTVEAAILHRGDRITSGHYTTLLHTAGETMFCDDGDAPQPLAADTCLVVGSQFCSREVYMLICRRGEAPTCQVGTLQFPLSPFHATWLALSVCQVVRDRDAWGPRCGYAALQIQ